MTNKVNYKKLGISIPIDQWIDILATRNNLPVSKYISQLIDGPLKERLKKGKI